MKRPLLIFTPLLFLFFSCAQAGDAGGDENVNPVAPVTGKLYLRTVWWSSGLSIGWLYLGTDGTVIRDPKHGVDPVNIQLESADNQANIGKYKVGAKTISVTFKDGKKEEWSFEKSKGDFSSIDGGLTTLQKSLPVNYKLNGSFATRAVTANLSASSTITFANNGKFTESRMGAVSVADDSAVSTDKNAGTYAIKGNTLRMNYNDGRKEVAVITVMNIAGKKYLIINSSSYPQEK